MPVQNPLWAIIGIALMACFCGLLSKRIAVIDNELSVHSKTLPLDGLRGILAASVFFHHASIMHGLFTTGVWASPPSNFYDQLGPTAVTFFFFISGYLFWRKLVRNPASVRASKLFPNRARRIIPAYLGATVLLFATVAITSGFQLREPGINVFKESLHWLCFGFPYEAGPQLNGFLSTPLTGGIFWTLQFEWFFYFLLPALTWARHISRVFLLMVFAICFTKATAHYHPHGSNLAVLVLHMMQRFAHMFFTGFAIGMLVSYGPGNEHVVRALRSSWMTVAAIGLLAVQLFFIRADYDFIEPLLLIPVFMLIAAGNSFFGVLTSLPMRALGTISYSVYVFHALILHACVLALNHFEPLREMSMAVYWLCILGIGLLVVLISTSTYRFIEKPFLFKRS